jgi:hypothetical protein
MEANSFDSRQGVLRMDGLLIIAILILLASSAAVVGTVVFAIWTVQYFGRRAYRQATRRHLYVPVDARVTRRVVYGRRATLHVVYEFGGVTIKNRFLTANDVARSAEQSRQIALQIDPDYPKDIVVDPAFEMHAATTPRPPGRAMLLGPAALLVLLGAYLAIMLEWAKRPTLGSFFFVVLAMSLTLVLSVIWLLQVGWRLKTQDGNRPDKLAKEDEKDLSR